jgi:hypothetical protein
MRRSLVHAGALFYKWTFETMGDSSHEILDEFRWSNEKGLRPVPPRSRSVGACQVTRSSDWPGLAMYRTRRFRRPPSRSCRKDLPA